MTATTQRQSLIKRAVLVIAASSFLAACTGENDREVFGTLLGAGLGGWLGAEIGGHGNGKAAGAAIGTLAGAAIGNSIGKSLDRADRLAQAEARYRALENSPSGERSTWYNPDSGNYGSVTPEPAYETENGYCREYTQTITVGGKRETGYGTACRQPDGSWKIVSG